MKRYRRISICILVILIAIIISLLEYGRYVILGAPYGANFITVFNKHLPCGLTPRFTEHAYHDMFRLDAVGHRQSSNYCFYWQSSYDDIMAWHKDLISYRVDPQNNSVILEVSYEKDTLGREREWVYLNSEREPLTRDTVFIEISCGAASNQKIYREKEVHPETIKQWGDFDVTLISSNITVIEDIVWKKRMVRLRLITLFVLLIQALSIGENKPFCFSNLSLN